MPIDFVEEQAETPQIDFIPEGEETFRTYEIPKEQRTIPTELISPGAKRVPLPSELTTAGGPRVPLASYAETMESIRSGAETPAMRFVAPRPQLTEPRLALPEIPISPEESQWTAGASEVINMAKSVPEFFTSDLGVMALFAGKLSPRLVSSGFTVDMAKSAFEQYKQAYQNWDKMTPAQKMQARVRFVGTMLMGGAAGGHAAGLPVKAPPPPRIQGPVTIGEMLKTPRGAVAPRPEVVPVERLTPEQSQALAEKMTQEATAALEESKPSAVEAGKAEPGPVPAEAALPREAEVKPVEPPTGEPQPAISETTTVPEKTQAAPEPAAPVTAPKAKEPWEMTRGDIANRANIRAKLAPELPAQPPSDYWVLKSITDKANKKPYNPDLLVGQGILRLKKGGFISGIKHLKLTDKGRNQFYDWQHTQREYDLAYGNLADQLIDKALDQHKLDVAQARREGKPVPPEVLADYPDLAKTAESQKPPSPQPSPGKEATSQGAEGISGAISTVAKGVRSKKIFNAETELGGPDILSWITENMRMASKSVAKASKGKDWWKLNQSLFDDSAPLARPQHNVIYGGKSMPDQVAQAAYEAGVIKSPDVPVLWAEIKRASAARSKIFENTRRELKFLQEEAKATEEWIKATAKGEKRVTADELKVGDVMEVEGERVEVVSIDPDTGDVVLKDGSKFGKQTLPEGRSIWVEKFEEPKQVQSEELFAPEDMPFNLAGEKIEFVEPRTEKTGFGGEMLAQDELFAIQKIVKHVDPEKSANAAQEMYGGASAAIAKLQRQLEVIDSDPKTKKTFAKEQRDRLKEVIALLRKRAIKAEPQKVEEIIGFGGAVPKEFGPAEPMTTATKNAAVDRDRVDRGLPPMMDALRKSDPDLWAQAMNAIAHDWQAPDKLIARFEASPFIPTDVETMILLHRRVDLKNEFAKAERERALAEQEGRGDAAEAAKAVRDQMNEKLTALDEMMGKGDRAAGTMAGRAFRARQLVMNEDYSLGELVREFETSAGRKATDPEIAELKSLADQWQKKSVELEKAYQSSETKRQEAEANLIAEQARRDAEKSAYHPKVLQMAEEYAKKWDARGEKALAELKDLFKGENELLSGPINPEILDRLAIYGVSKIVRGTVDFAKWTDGMVKEIGPRFAAHAQTVWDAAQKLLDQDLKVSQRNFGNRGKKVAEAIKKGEAQSPQEKINATIEKLGRRLEKNPDIALDIFARKLAREFWMMGIRKPAEIVDAVHAEFVKVLPEFTRRETSDVLSRYGRLWSIPMDAVSVGLRDVYGQLQQVSKLEDMAMGIAPRRTGFPPRTFTEELRHLIKQVEEAKKRGGYEVTDPETQLRTAMQAAQRRLENQIADLEHEIETRTRIVKDKRKLQYDDKLKALVARRDALREIHKEVFKPEPLTDAQRLAIWKERTLEKIEDYKERLAAGDVMPRKRPEPVRLDPEALKIQFELQKVHNAILDKRVEAQLAQRTFKRKIIDGIGNTLRTSWALMTGGEFSAVLRQGGWLVFTHPIVSFRSIVPMFKALMSEEAQFRVTEDIHTRLNAPLYKKSGLELGEIGIRLSNMEEFYMFRFSERMRKMRGIKYGVKYLEAFQRAYTTFLAKSRADVFDKLVDTYGSDLNTAKDIAYMINIGTGRGSTGLGRYVGPGANAILFAPRYSISRFQLLTGQPLWHASKGNRLMILKEYGRALSSAAVVYTLGALAGGKVEIDPRSAEFGKIRMGNTRIDPMAGLLQATRLLATVGTGWRKDRKGKLVPIRESYRFFPSGGPTKVPFGQPTGAEVVGKFLRTKLSPSVGTAISGVSGRTPVGEKFTLGDTLISLTTPITYGDVLKAIEEQGVPKGAAMATLAIFGMGVQTYDQTQKKE